MNRIKVSTYAKRVGLSPQAVRSYFHAGVYVVTSFCARLYGQRRGKRKTETIIKDLTNENS